MLEIVLTFSEEQKKQALKIFSLFISKNPSSKTVYFEENFCEDNIFFAEKEGKVFLTNDYAQWATIVRGELEIFYPCSQCKKNFPAGEMIDNEEYTELFCGEACKKLFEEKQEII